MFLTISSGKLSDESAQTESSSANPWVTGGPIGTKNAVLVFRTSALANHNDAAHDQENFLPEKPQKCVPNIAPHPKDHQPRFAEQCPKLTPANLSVYNKRMKAQPNDSLSSSEHSISSAGDDRAESEADPYKREHSIDRSMRRFGEAVHGNRASTSVSSMEKEGGSLDEDDETDISNMPAAVLKLTYKFTNTETKLLRRILSSHGLQEANENQTFNLLWTGLHMKPDILRNLTPYQRINHFPRWVLGNVLTSLCQRVCVREQIIE